MEYVSLVKTHLFKLLGAIQSMAVDRALAFQMIRSKQNEDNKIDPSSSLNLDAHCLILIQFDFKIVSSEDRHVEKNFFSFLLLAKTI